MSGTTWLTQPQGWFIKGNKLASPLHSHSSHDQFPQIGLLMTFYLFVRILLKFLILHKMTSDRIYNTFILLYSLRVKGNDEGCEFNYDTFDIL
jgi:hypothetical protein